MTKQRLFSLTASLLAILTIVLIGCGNTNKAEPGKSKIADPNYTASSNSNPVEKQPEAKAQTSSSQIANTPKGDIKPTFKVKEKGLYAEIQTSKGNILIELEMEKTPLTVTNFVGLAEGTIKNNKKSEGQPYYDGLKFHRVIADFMIQGGCPLGNGSGDPGYKFADEVRPDLKHDGPGVLSMANSGPHTNGSQFFITHKATPWLDNVHTVFGHVVEGMDVVNSIANGDAINHVVIIRKGKEAKDFDATQASFDQLRQGAQARLKQTFKDYLKEVATEKCGGNEVKQAGDGLFYCVTSKGKGPKPQPGQKVTAKYKGTFPDGKVFDQGEYTFALKTGSVIQGWHVGFAELNQGDKATLVIPYWLAYGEQSGRMPGRSNLIFEVELLSIQ